MGLTKYLHVLSELFVYFTADTRDCLVTEIVFHILLVGNQFTLSENPIVTDRPTARRNRIFIRNEASTFERMSRTVAWRNPRRSN